ncbi:hypothetical protein [Flavobacterium sp. N1736]|uniref:hypothetical protein n=1 Tax=Flavobacterium sp. N1736 TaxID=2986823 RepID=UPI0022247268|nr:hypothetical protein [Flavobacterium sp. N1736]
MKRFKLQSIALIVFFVTILSSCSSDNDNPEAPTVVYKSAFATEVTGPTTGKVGQELTYSIGFTVENGCGEFNRFTDVEFNKLSGFQIEAKYPVATCTRLEPQTIRTLYKIKPTTKGTFYLRIAKSETEYISTTVVID